MSEKNAEKAVIYYDDGTKKEIQKGFFCEMMPLDNPDGEIEMVFCMMGVAGDELANIVYGVMELGVRLGMFGDE